MVFISLTTRLPRFSDRWDLSEVELSLVLLMIVLLAGAGSVVAERLAHRSSSASTLRAGLLTIGVAVPVVAAAPTELVFVLALAAYGVGLGIVDAASNMQAVAVEHRYGRTILPSFHGAWTFGGIVGACYALAAAHAPLWTAGLVAVVPLLAARRAVPPPRARRGRSPRPQRSPSPGGRSCWSGSGWCSSTWSTPPPRPGDRPSSTTSSTRRTRWWRWRRCPTWSPAWSCGWPATPSWRGTAPRWSCAPARCVASLALLVVVTAPTWPVAVLGFTLLGAGVSVIAPLSFSAAARIAGGDRARVDAVIARFNQFNYVGGLLGAVLTGLVGAGSLRLGFAVPMVLILAMLPLARSFAPAGVSAPRAR